MVVTHMHTLTASQTWHMFTGSGYKLWENMTVGELHFSKRFSLYPVVFFIHVAQLYSLFMLPSCILYSCYQVVCFILIFTKAIYVHLFMPSLILYSCYPVLFYIQVPPTTDPVQQALGAIATNTVLIHDAESYHGTVLWYWCVLMFQCSDVLHYSPSIPCCYQCLMNHH